MSFEGKTWEDRLCEYPARRRLEVVEGSVEAGRLVVDVEPEPGEVHRVGDAFSAANMNGLERRVGEAVRGVEFDLLALRGEALLKAVYDANGDGKVDRAEAADTAASADNAAKLGGQGASHYATAAALNAKANTADVLAKTNTTAYTPTASYHPATKAYVDSVAGGAGAGDMLKSVYDPDGDGKVLAAERADGAEHADGAWYANEAANAWKLGGQDPSYFAAADICYTHVNRADNPHMVTCSQIGAMPWTGGAFAGDVAMGAPNTQGGRLWFRSATHSGYVQQEDHELVYHLAANVHFQQGEAGAYANAYARAFIQQQSTRRVKKNIRVLDLAESKKFLDAPVVSFKFRKNAMFYDEARHVGTIAEDIAEINEAYVIRGVDGEVEAVRYDLLTVPLLQLVQDLSRRVEELERRAFGDV